MKAVVIERPHEAVFREVETPVCGPGDVLVRSRLRRRLPDGRRGAQRRARPPLGALPVHPRARVERRRRGGRGGRRRPRARRPGRLRGVLLLRRLPPVPGGRHAPLRALRLPRLHPRRRLRRARARPAARRAPAAGRGFARRGRADRARVGRAQGRCCGRDRSPARRSAWSGSGTLGALAIVLARLFSPAAVVAYGIREAGAASSRAGSARTRPSTSPAGDCAHEGELDLVVETAGAVAARRARRPACRARAAGSSRSGSPARAGAVSARRSVRAARPRADRERRLHHRRLVRVVELLGAGPRRLRAGRRRPLPGRAVRRRLRVDGRAGTASSGGSSWSTRRA